MNPLIVCSLLITLLHIGLVICMNRRQAACLSPNWVIGIGAGVTSLFAPQLPHHDVLGTILPLASILAFSINAWFLQNVSLPSADERPWWMTIRRTTPRPA